MRLFRFWRESFSRRGSACFCLPPQSDGRRDRPHRGLNEIAKGNAPEKLIGQRPAPTDLLRDTGTSESVFPLLFDSVPG